MSNKKGQIEIMGLAIIVILITLVMIFVIRFAVLNKPEDFKGSYTQTELASNMVNTFLKSTSRNCNGLSMTELLQDCAQIQGIYCEDAKPSCEYVLDTAREVFGSTLDAWNLAYEFKTYFEERRPIFKLGEACPGAKKSKLFLVPTSTQTLNVKLDICN